VQLDGDRLAGSGARGLARDPSSAGRAVDLDIDLPGVDERQPSGRPGRSSDFLIRNPHRHSAEIASRDHHHDRAQRGAAGASANRPMCSAGW